MTRSIIRAFFPDPVGLAASGCNIFVVQLLPSTAQARGLCQTRAVPGRYGQPASAQQPLAFCVQSILLGFQVFRASSSLSFLFWRCSCLICSASSRASTAFSALAILAVYASAGLSLFLYTCLSCSVVSVCLVGFLDNQPRFLTGEASVSLHSQAKSFLCCLAGFITGSRWNSDVNIKRLRLVWR